MNNFAIKIGDKEFWISRSVAAVGFIFNEYDNEYCILAVQRSEAAADNHHKWCCPCGYIDYNETIAQGCAREIYEETALQVKDDKLILYGINDSPEEARQNITFLYYQKLPQLWGLPIIYGNNSSGEIEKVKWIKLDDLDDYDWAFNHKNLILEIFESKIKE